MFKGFQDVPLPEYEVITPQTLKSYTVRSMTVQEEERLKGSMITPQKITEHINRCIYDLIVKKPEEIKDYNTFERITTTKDRDALLYGIYHVSYGEIRNYDIKCNNCNKSYPVTISASSTFNITPYDKKKGDILKKEIEIPLTIFKGVKATIKQPTLMDELNVLTSFGSGKNDSVVADSIPIVKFEQIVAEKEPVLITEKEDIIDAMFSLSPKDRKLINEKYEDNFGKYCVELKMKSFCPNCGEEQISTIDLVTQFFRMVWGS